MSKQFSDLQSKFIADGKRDSCLDPAVPIGFTINARPLDGMSVTQWFREKHKAGPSSYGRFWPLHETLTFERR